ncbi:MAG TPA: HAMP domain-containing sensor histidine kinase [Spirochaetia bacterium]|nr:HAMP domain-containing sensor histidine kinase [Spirochaetia bacterium]
MEKVQSFLVTVTITLLVCEAALLVARAARCARRFEPLSLAAFLLAAALGLAEPSWLGTGSALSVFILWAAGAFLVEARRPSRRFAWAAACCAFMGLLLVGRGLRLDGTILFTAFDAAVTCALAAFPIALMAGIGKGSRSSPLFAALVAACAWIALGCAQSLLWALGLAWPDVSEIPLFVLAAAGAWLVFQEGYPTRAGWRGRLAALELAEKLPHAAYAPVVENESMLARQDRLVAAGLLVLGVAHEFKNTLGYIRAVAEHCLTDQESPRRDEDLRLLLQHVENGRESAVGLLEKLAREGREKTRVVDAERDLASFMRLVRAGYRAEGVIIRGDFAPGTRFRARPGEIEQILHNLVRNAVESLRRRGATEEKLIDVSCRRAGSKAIIEVKDNAGGVALSRAPRLFTPSFHRESGSGLGLYLSRSLARDNGASLDYAPVPGGSIFRLTLRAEPG